LSPTALLQPASCQHCQVYCCPLLLLLLLAANPAVVAGAAAASTLRGLLDHPTSWTLHLIAPVPLRTTAEGMPQLADVLLLESFHARPCDGNMGSTRGQWFVTVELTRLATSWFITIVLGCMPMLQTCKAVM
jgi:hypothetical protein